METKPDFYFIDTHAHLDMLKQKTPDFAVKESIREGVKYIINVGSSLSGSRKSSEYSRQYSNVFASVGIHPHYAGGFSVDDIRLLKEVIDENKKVIAVGETGFDYYRDLSPREGQKKAFIAQIELALQYGLPVIVHDREAHDDILEVLKEYAVDKRFRAVIHCFSGSTGFALECIELGFYISFTGVITFPNAKELLETVREVPIERIFLETDAPFLAPQQKRGQENYPGFVKLIASRIAEIKDISIGEVARTTSRNAEGFFSIK